MKTIAEPRITIGTFESGCIVSREFNHTAHIYVAWLYLQRYPTADAISRCTTGLRRLTAKFGVPDKYHATISWFFLLLIAERRTAAPSACWEEFCQKNEDLFCREHNILTRYYSSQLLASERARTSFVLPDKVARQAA
jgi:hypothetical protein